MERAILSEKWALSAERGAFFLPGNQSLFARVSRGGLRLLFLFANQRREENTPTTKIVKIICQGPADLGLPMITLLGRRYIVH